MARKLPKGWRTNRSNKKGYAVKSKIAKKGRGGGAI